MLCVLLIVVNKKGGKDKATGRWVQMLESAVMSGIGLLNLRTSQEKETMVSEWSKTALGRQCSSGWTEIPQSASVVEGLLGGGGGCGRRWQAIAGPKLMRSWGAINRSGGRQDGAC